MFDKNLCNHNKRVNDELVNIDNWLKSNKLTPNYTKTKFMIISHDKNAKSNFEVTINYTKTKFMIISHDKNAKSNFEVTINKVPVRNTLVLYLMTI